MATPINNEDKRKQTLEAIERRFKQSEADVHFQQHKDKKRLLEDKVKPKQDNKSPCIVSLTGVSNSPAIKGPAAKQDPDLNNPAYFELLYPVNENLVTMDKGVDPKSTVGYILHECLQHGDVAPKYIQGSRSLKIDKSILLDNFVPKGGEFGAAQERALKRLAKRSKKHASLKKHKMLGSFDLPTEYHNFERFRPLHEMWKSYISQLMKKIGKNQLERSLLNVELHGAIILVVHCKVSAFSGVRGIIIRETEETFGIITQDNKFRVVPKKLSVFMLQVESWKVTLHGDKLGDKLTGRSMVP